MIATLTKIFNYLQSTGVLAAGIAFLLAVWKAALPIAKAHAKTSQQKALLTLSETIVAKFAQYAGLSMSDRFKEACRELSTYANEHGYSWVTESLIESIVEAAYQEYKASGKQIVKPVTVPDDSSEASDDVQTSDQIASSQVSPQEGAVK